MGATYTRQSSATIVDGATIEASHFNAEFDQILAAFAASTGHTHDGTANEGGPITKLLGNTLTFGAATAGTDITITFDGETSDGVLKWMEDEDYFEFSDDILIGSTEKLQFRDTAIYINSSTDGQLDLVADTEIQIAATTVDINGNVDISGTLTVAGALDFGDANISNIGSIALDTITNDGTDITLDSSGDIILDADGADITLKDAGTTFGSLTNSSGELVIKSGSTPTAAITLSGANTTIEGNLTVDGNFDVTGTLDFSDSAITNVGSIQLDSIAGDADSNTSITFSGSDVITMATGGTSALTIDASQNVTIAGDLTVSGDDITMATNTSGNLLIADGTNFNSVAATSLSEISTVANDDVLLAVDTSGGGLKKISRSTLVAGLATSGAISNVAEDSTPQLGGNLDVNGNDIVTTSNADIELAPNGTGKVVIKGNTNQGKLVLNCEANSHGQTIIAAPHSESANNVLTLPSTGGDSRLLSATSTATLTNKTLTSPKINEDVAVTSTATELNLLDGITAGTVSASLAVIADSNKDISGFRNVTLTGELDAATLDISGNADIDGTLEADAITIGGVTLAETISDTVGAMVSSNTETGISVTYDDSDNTLDFVIGAGSIVNSMLADDAVGADELAANAVVNASIASGAAIADTKLATISTAGKVALTALEIDGGSDIGADLTTSDLIIVDDGAGGTNKKAALSRVVTLMTAQGFSQEDPTALAIALG
jgi:cytoskeletal protein CcmA (bactofilin family)